jgi:membrane-bound lytic murein transglycosylase A
MRPIKGVAKELTEEKNNMCGDSQTGQQGELAKALEGVLPWLDARPDAVMTMGELKILRSQYAAAIRKAIAANKNGQAWQEIFSKDFEWMEVYGREDYGDILLTSYYSPIISASKKSRAPFTQPIYAVPEDLVELDLEQWRQHSGQETKIKSMRLVPPIKSPEGDWRPPRLVPYYSRAEIDRMGKLEKHNKILGYVDPIDAFFLHIQGSGKLLFEDKSVLHVGYATQNGHPYYSIGKSLWEVIPVEKMSMARIEQYLRSVSPEVRDRLMDLNPSYIFFRALTDKTSITTSGAQAVAGHTVAIDNSLFPLGMVGWLYFPKPQAEANSIDPTFPDQANCGRYVVAQDTGGAIRGADRLDLFWGEGHDAMITAGAMRHRARLYWLAPKRF